MIWLADLLACCVNTCLCVCIVETGAVVEQLCKFELHLIPMTDLLSMMDKIRILRSSRKKTSPGSASSKETFITTPPKMKSKLGLPNSGKNWVPFLVVDINKPKGRIQVPEPEDTVEGVSSSLGDNSDMDTMPSLTPVVSRDDSVDAEVISTSENPSIKSVTSKRSSPRKSRRIPDKCTIMITSKDVRFNKDRPKKSKESPKHPQNKKSTAVESPVFSNSVTPTDVPLPTSDPLKEVQKDLSPELQKEAEPQQPSEMHYNTNSLAPVGCVICSKQFSTLSEMQIHYLSEHKNRRGRENRKRSGEEIQKTSSVTSTKGKEGAVEIGFKFPLYVNENDPKCPVCSIAFKNALEVRNHVKLVHSYRCSECKDTFYTLFEFTGHKCSKSIKKFRRVRKKSGRNSSTNQEAEKTTENSVSVLPSVKEKSTERNNGVSDSIPPLLPKVTSDSGFVPLTSSSSKVVDLTNLRTEVQISENSRLQITSVSHPTESQIPNIRTPSPKLTISPLDKKPDPPKIRVLETKNLRCFKFKKEEISPDTAESKKELIQEKISQLKNNPQLSVSWIPKLHARTEDEDYEYVCGRCNVICDDMEDYTDHIQDCLTITSVTMERTSNPPQRILKLQKEVSSFGFQETNNNTYRVNKNLMKKLQEVLPLTEEDVRESSSSPRCHQKEVFYCGGGVRTPDAAQEDQLNGPVFRDATVPKLDIESSILSIKEEPIDDYAESVEDVDFKNSSIHLFESGSSCIQSVSNSKGNTPMVIIPLGHDVAKNLPLRPNDQVIDGKQSIKLPSPGSSSPSSPWDSSSTDLLIDTDDIKMEVEEEVIEDDFEVR